MLRLLTTVGIAAVVAFPCAACTSGVAEKLGLSGGKTMDEERALELVKRAEATGALEKGMEIEHFVGGGGPPPHYRLDQFRLIVRDGGPVFNFVTPDFTAKVKQRESYPSHVYSMKASPEEVRTMARLVRESGAFSAAPPASAGRDGVRDRLRSEVVVILDGKEAKRIYTGAEPPELAKLQAFVNPKIARLKSHGTHRVEP